MVIKKTMFELCREFPNKTYRELEIYRDADRQEEAQRIITQQENKELKEDQLKESWKEKYEKEHKLRQEAEGELTILKGIETNRVKEAQARSNQLQNELDRVKKENNDLYNRLSDVIDPLEKMRKDGL
tara:strand:- start:258 stop:641 length:384 start_codon:yes stop_codon:yes gene_type:complete